MGRKNKNEKKKKKESDGSTGNINGSGGSNSSSNNSSSNNNHNNNISIPTVDETAVVATTTMVLTQQDREDEQPNGKRSMTTTSSFSAAELDSIDNEFKLAGYPKSRYFVIGYRLKATNNIDAAVTAFKRGADNGCVPCIFSYANEQYHKRNNYHLVVPFALEGAIRGHIFCMSMLMACYQTALPFQALAVDNFWAKSKLEFGETVYTEERRKEVKKKHANSCFVCGKRESEDDDSVTLVKCGICKYYSYCGTTCQAYHWKEGKHMNECRQVILLRKYCKISYIKEIRDAIMDGQDPKKIHTLQRLRMKLGLNRPTEEYKELLLILGVDDTTDTNRSPNRKEYLVGRKDGTVHIGSTPHAI